MFTWKTVVKTEMNDDSLQAETESLSRLDVFESWRPAALHRVCIRQNEPSYVCHHYDDSTANIDTSG